ncbi:GH22210 [Drosophila grimshawi]|uniref:GH22210 n=1 Tax=Drosophila grimshawi TaxID=7222 RepID=B4K3B5_DROGR|nr:GH22210 [Drosophila grimshawi]
MEQLLMLPAICLTLLLLTWSSSAQVPPVACPEYFQYLAYNQEYIGRVSVRHDPQYAENTLRIQFSQRGSLTSVSFAKLDLMKKK